jgi:citrate lyase subunit beta / citryl-CoA lyase
VGILMAGEVPEPVIRSLLFAPANEARKVRHLVDSGADAVVLDLEDAVADSQKVAARAIARDALSGLRGPLRCVRVNPLGTGLTEGDIAAVVCADLDALVLPKVEHRRDLEIADRLIRLAEAREGIALGSVVMLVLIETARGLTMSDRIARFTDRRIRIVLGSGDLGTDLARPTIRGSLVEALAYGRGKLVYDARAAGLAGPIDGPCLYVRDIDALEVDCRAGAALGHTGKVCIHPAQVPVVNRVFSPSPEELDYAKQVIEAFETAETAGAAAIEVGGVFIDYPIVYKARRILSLAASIAATRDRTSKEGAPE